MDYSPLAPEGNITRVVNEKIERHLSALGAVEASRAKWSGKTWTPSCLAQVPGAVASLGRLRRRPSGNERTGPARFPTAK